MKEIVPGIFHIPSVSEPLSSDVFIVEGEKRFYVFDVGTGDAAYEAVAGLDKPATVILSHFRQDHTGNMTRLSPVEVLCGARTRKHLGQGTPVENVTEISDGVLIRVQPCVSPHAPGCLIMTVNDACTFLGDLCYARPGTGQGEAKGMYRVLKGMKTEYFIQSHRTEDLLQEKETVLREIKDYFGI